MLLNSLKEICDILNKMDRAKDKTLSHAEIINNTNLSQKEVGWLFDSMEKEGYLAYTGRDCQNKPIEYQLLKSTTQLSLLEIMRCAGMKNIFIEYTVCSQDNPALAGLSTDIQEKLKTIFIDEIR
jgi:orotate phosphoribosyltransferase-like protein